MSKSTNQSENRSSNYQTRDIYQVCKESFQKIHGHIEKATPQYLQSFTNLQDEYLGIWMNFVNSSLAIQQHYASKAGINTNATEALTKVVHDSTEEIVKSYDSQNRIAFTIIDATRQTLKTINENATAFAELNEKIVDSWISTWVKN